MLRTRGRWISSLLAGPALALAAAGAPAGGAMPAAEERSVIAVVTHKAGFASGLAHDHLIAAVEHELNLRFDPAEAEATSLDFRVAVENLRVDDDDLRRTWFPRLNELEILDDGPKELSDRDRAKIRRTMLGPKQLDADAHTGIAATISAVRLDAPGGESAEFPHVVEVALTVRGRTATRPLRARYAIDDRRVTVEAYGTYRFSDFGIEPYSAMLGAVKNLDEFHVYVNVTLPVPLESGADPKPQQR